MTMAASAAFTVCSLLMASLFACSASVQLNDPDWYFWFPLYACACVVNLMNRAASSQKLLRRIAKLTICLGTFLFLKVVAEDFVGRKAGFWSLDLSDRVVREKTGSGLVIISMILHLEAKCDARNPLPRNKKLPGYVEWGMAILVSFSFGLPFVFFVVQRGEMKFDHIK